MGKNQRNTADGTRWICPRCGRPNGAELLCPGCGFDGSADLLSYPTLARPDREYLNAWAMAAAREPEQPRPSRKRRGPLIAGVAAVLLLGVALIAFNGSADSNTAGTDTVGDGDLLGYSGSIDGSVTVDIISDADDGDVDNEADVAVSTDVTTAAPSNVLGDVGRYDDTYDGTALSLDGVTAKKDITEIYFLDTLADAPADAADLSAAGDGSVLCWTEGTTQYIAGEGGVVGGSSCEYLFMGYINVTAIHFSGCFGTSGVTDMTFMFHSCCALTSLDLSGWDTSGVTGMRSMFYNCESLTSLDLSGWDTSSVIDMSKMFSGCTDLEKPNLSGWDTSSVTDMSDMFYNCRSLTSQDLSSWDTSSVTNMSYMFRGCYELTWLDLSGWDISNVTDMSYMFIWCSGLTSLDLSGWDTSNVMDMMGMFYDCSSLTDFDPSWLDTSNADTTSMYTGTIWE